MGNSIPYDFCETCGAYTLTVPFCDCCAPRLESGAFNRGDRDRHRRHLAGESLEVIARTAEGHARQHYKRLGYSDLGVKYLASVYAAAAGTVDVWAHP